MAKKPSNFGQGGAMHDIWDRGYSVLLTSFWDWMPECWASIGWTGDRGRSRRNNLLQELTDPFIAVCYLTKDWPDTDPDQRGKIAGFFLVTHETGDRNDFVDPMFHDNDLGKWRHALKPSRAFTYLPESRLKIEDIVQLKRGLARSISSAGKILTDPEKLRDLRTTPWTEVEIYRSSSVSSDIEEVRLDRKGMVRGGPASPDGYVVSAGTEWLPRELYILELEGDVDAYRGEPSQGRRIIKVGLSASPVLRCRSFQKALPEGRYQWVVERTTRNCGLTRYANHTIAKIGEDAMKCYLRDNAEWLGGEFYLVADEDIEAAWQAGCQAAGKAEL